MDDYINRYEQFEKSIVYNFELGNGGIGDCIKFFMVILDSCIKNNVRLYYKKNNIILEDYIKLKYDKMYITNDIKDAKRVVPQDYYSIVDTFTFSININEVFYFTEEVKLNRNTLLSPNITDYISIHLRLGDKHLETDKKYVMVKFDSRAFSEDSIERIIKDNYNNNIFFCCDNNAFKLKLKEKYNTIIITNCEIGHTSLRNTTQKQILDSITEFYILTESTSIFGITRSGFSYMASKFKNIPLVSCV
jgi:hypothetical protein